MANGSFFEDMIIGTQESADALVDLYERDCHFVFTHERSPNASEEFLAELSDYMDKL